MTEKMNSTAAAPRLRPVPWAMTASHHRQLLHELPQRYEAARAGPAFEPARSSLVGDVAVIPVHGPLTQRDDFVAMLFGGTTYERLNADVQRALADPNVGSILLDLDSPGGEAIGLGEFSAAIFEGRKRKPIIAVVSGLALSGGYFVASSAERVFVGRDSLVGSVGAVLRIVDFTKADEMAGVEVIDIVSSQSPRKVPDAKTDEGRAQLQREVDAVADVFVNSVARNRDLSRERVLSDFGAGAVFVGEEAVRAGMVDGTGTLDSVLGDAASAGPGEGGGRRASLSASSQHHTSRARPGDAQPGRPESVAQRLEAYVGNGWMSRHMALQCIAEGLTIDQVGHRILEAHAAEDEAEAQINSSQPAPQPSAGEFRIDLDAVYKRWGHWRTER